MRLGIYLTLICILLSSVDVIAQSPKNVTVNFSTLSWKRTIKDLHFRNANGELVKLWIPNGSPSDIYTYVGPLPVRFFKIVGEDAEGNPIEETAASYTPKESGQELLIFITNKNSAESGYQILALPFDKSKISQNSYRFVNLSSFPVYTQFGDDQFKVGVREEETIRVNIDGKSGRDIAMAVQISDQPNDAKIAYSSAWSIRDGRSALIFITTESESKGRIDVKRLYF